MEHACSPFSSLPHFSFSIRDIRLSDLTSAAHICVEAFSEHNISLQLPPSIDFSDVDSTLLLIQNRLDHPSVDGVVAVDDTIREIVGVGFIHYGRKVNSVTGVAVDPKVSGRGVGKALLLALLQKSAKTEALSIRLTQSATNTKSFALYCSLGFMPVECPCNFVGNLQPTHSRAAAALVDLNLDDFEVRKMEEEDVKTCSDLFERVLGYDREKELRDTLSLSPMEVLVVTRSGSIEGFSTGFRRTGFTVATSEEACVALYSHASGHVFLQVICQLYPKILKWALAVKLPLLRNTWIMVCGEYQRPKKGLVWAPCGLH